MATFFLSDIFPAYRRAALVAKYTNPARGILDFCKQKFFSAPPKGKGHMLIWSENSLRVK